MAKKTPITLSGEEHVLHFDANAVADLEDEYDLDVSITKQMRAGNFSHGLLRALLAAGLSHKGGMTKRRAGDMIQKHLDGGGTLGDIAAALAIGLVNSGVYGKVEKAKEGVDPKADAAPPAAPVAEANESAG